MSTPTKVSGLLPIKGILQMKLKTKNVCGLALLFAAWITITPFMIAEPEAWPQFRGPNGSGVSTSTNLPVEFGPQKNVIWKAELPPGHSSPVLTRDRIFITAHTKGDNKQQAANSKTDYKLLV